MATIKLTQGEEALVDDEDFEKLNQYSWHLHRFKKKGYKWMASRIGVNDEEILMHREIMQCPSTHVVDHINGDNLDNRKANLRVCTNAENCRNRRGPRKGNLSGYKGVSWSHGKWHAVVMKNGKQYSFGYFNDPKEAAIARDQAAVRLHGEFASLNFPEEILQTK